MQFAVALPKQSSSILYVEFYRVETSYEILEGRKYISHNPCHFCLRCALRETHMARIRIFWMTEEDSTLGSAVAFIRFSFMPTFYYWRRYLISKSLAKWDVWRHIVRFNHESSSSTLLTSTNFNQMWSGPMPVKRLLVEPPRDYIDNMSSLSSSTASWCNRYYDQQSDQKNISVCLYDHWKLSHGTYKLPHQTIDSFCPIYLTGQWIFDGESWNAACAKNLVFQNCKTFLNNWTNYLNNWWYRGSDAFFWTLI